MRWRGVHALTVFVLALVSGCGGSDGNSDPVSAVPADAAFYVEVDVDPDGPEQEWLDRIVEKLPGEGHASERLSTVIDSALAATGLDASFEDDVEPWLGDRVALFASRFSLEGEVGEGAAVLSTEDSKRAEEAISDVMGSDGGSYRGVEYRERSGGFAGMVDDLVVVGTKEGFEAAVDAAEDRTLADTRPYRQWREELPDHWTAAMFIGDVDRLVRSGFVEPSARELLRAFTRASNVTLQLREAGVLVDSVVPRGYDLLSGFPIGGGTRLVETLPGDAWLAIGLPDLARNLRSLGDFVPKRDLREMDALLRTEVGLDAESLLGWMGHGAIVANGRPGNPYNAALVVRVTNRGAADRAVDALLAAIRAGGVYRVRSFPVEFRPSLEAHSITGPDLPAPIEVVRSPREVAVALGAGTGSAAIEPAERRVRLGYEALGDDEEFRTALRQLGEGFRPASYLAVDELMAIVESFVPQGEEGFEKARPYIEVFDSVISGTRSAGRDEQTVRTLLQVK